MKVNVKVSDSKMTIMIISFKRKVTVLELERVKVLVLKLKMKVKVYELKRKIKILELKMRVTVLELKKAGQCPMVSKRNVKFLYRKKGQGFRVKKSTIPTAKNQGQCPGVKTKGQGLRVKRWSNKFGLKTRLNDIIFKPKLLYLMSFFIFTMEMPLDRILSVDN